jgi:hypothetical protein
MDSMPSPRSTDPERDRRAIAIVPPRFVLFRDAATSALAIATRLPNDRLGPDAIEFDLVPGELSVRFSPHAGAAELRTHDGRRPALRRGTTWLDAMAVGLELTCGSATCRYRAVRHRIVRPTIARVVELTDPPVAVLVALPAGSDLDTKRDVQPPLVLRRLPTRLTCAACGATATVSAGRAVAGHS